MAAARRTLLVVDDQPANVRVLAEILRGEFQVVFATSGARALEIARSQPVDLVLLDLFMPAMDGREVCRQLKADTKTRCIPVIFVTADGDAAPDAAALGAAACLSKPVEPEVLRELVRTHLPSER